MLLIEDDEELSLRLAGSLAAEGFTVERATRGDAGYEMGSDGQYDAVVMDLGLPGMSGLDILKRWRAEGMTTPILILSARGTWTERIEGLNAGADDYMAKPFQAAEVVARLHAMSRRMLGNASSVIRHGAIVLDTSAGSVTVDDQEIELTAQELRVLTYLMQRVGRIVSQDALSEHVYGLRTPRDSNTIEVFIARLRKKLGRDEIRTVRGLGYRIG